MGLTPYALFSSRKNWKFTSHKKWWMKNMLPHAARQRKTKLVMEILCTRVTGKVMVGGKCIVDVVFFGTFSRYDLSCYHFPISVIVIIIFCAMLVIGECTVLCFYSTRVCCWMCFRTICCSLSCGSRLLKFGRPVSQLLHVIGGTVWKLKIILQSILWAWLIGSFCINATEFLRVC